jgi:hypothetical protein
MGWSGTGFAVSAWWIKSVPLVPSCSNFETYTMLQKEGGGEYVSCCFYYYLLVVVVVVQSVPMKMRYTNDLMIFCVRVDDPR